MNAITARLITFKTVLDVLARRPDISPDTTVTITQEMLDEFDRELRKAQDAPTGSFDAFSIGSKRKTK